MNSVDLPHGVPTPFKTHVHPYPTRFHGGIWTRPVFGFPWVQRPHFVIRPSELNGTGHIEPVFRPYHGLGDANDVRTAGGVFRMPRYDGGGIFNSVSGTGLGSVPADIGKFLGAAALGFGVVALLMRR